MQGGDVQWGKLTGQREGEAQMGVKIGVIGASGAVGGMLVRVLAERGFSADDVRLFATQRSVGQRVSFGGHPLPIEVLTGPQLAGLELCFLAVPGATASLELAPMARAAGAIVIDKGSAFRLDPAVPLVVPEVNPEALAGHTGLIASPNCTTIPLVMVLAPLRRAAGGIRTVIVSTYQAASGAGYRGTLELREGATAILAGQEPVSTVFPRPLAFNVVPQCDRFGEAGYTQEEWKLVRESRKILGDGTLRLTATAVRVPVEVAHSESVYVELASPLTAAQARAALATAPGVVVQDDPEHNVYPTARDVAGSDETYVGRIRNDPDEPRALHLWIVADNLRKGAATNAVQIAELLMRGGH